MHCAQHDRIGIGYVHRPNYEALWLAIGGHPPTEAPAGIVTAGLGWASCANSERGRPKHTLCRPPSSAAFFGACPGTMEAWAVPCGRCSVAGLGGSAARATHP